MKKVLLVAGLLLASATSSQAYYSDDYGFPVESPRAVQSGTFSEQYRANYTQRSTATSQRTTQRVSLRPLFLGFFR